MTAVTNPVLTDKDVTYAEKVVSWNVRMLLTARGSAQSAMAEALGIQPGTMSNKIQGRIAWSLADIVRAAAFLETKPETLMDDSLMLQMGGNNRIIAAGDTRPRYFVMPERCPLRDSNPGHAD